MEMRHLRLVRTLAEEGTLTAAGKKLFLSQSALSHQLREIENELGVRLFHRSRRKMVPTAAGKRIVNSADVVLGEVDTVRSDISRMVSGDCGTLRVSACRSAGFHWLPAVLTVFKKHYPGIEVSIDTAPAHDPISNLLSDTIDLAIVNFKNEQNGIAYLKLFDDEMVAVVPCDHPWASKAQVNARSFGGTHLIGYDLPFEKMEIYRLMLGPAKITPLSLTRVPTTEAILELVSAGMGVAVVNRWSVEPCLQQYNLALVRLKRNGFARSWYAAITDNGRKPPYIAHFIGFLTNIQN